LKHKISLETNSLLPGGVKHAPADSAKIYPQLFEFLSVAELGHQEKEVMNRKEIILNEIRAVLQPEDSYFIQHNDNGLFYKASDYDLSIGKPIPGANGKKMKRSGQIFELSSCKVFF
jgi:hypothetical protein